MADGQGVWAAGLLVDEAWTAYGEGRYQEALAAASRAVEAAGQLDDLVLLARALRVEASTLRLMGDPAAALARYTQILAMADDPATSSRLDHRDAAEAIASAYSSWAESARYLTGIPVRELFGVLEAGERWLTATGHRDWRASLLLQRALVHNRLGEHDAAVAAAEEALAVAIQHPDAPGTTLNSFRFTLGDILRSAGRAAEAAAHYQAVLDDPGAAPYELSSAHEGLAWCALEAGDAAAARRQARSAVLLAEPLGDQAMCNPLDVLARACRGDGDLDAAWQAAIRHLEAAGRIGGHYRPYFAARTAFDIALDRGDQATARRLLGELGEHAAVLDPTTGDTTYTSEAEQRRRQLASLERASP
jgi:tetratricopeptide (TPR) repeat protein